MNSDLRRELSNLSLPELLEILSSDERLISLSLFLNASMALFSTEGDLLYLSRNARFLFGLPDDAPLPTYNICKDANFQTTEYSSLIRAALSEEKVFIYELVYKPLPSSICPSSKYDEIKIKIDFSPIHDRNRQTIIFALFQKPVYDIRSQPILLMQKSESAAMLARGIAHEFNNIFASQKGIISLLELELSPAQSSYHYLKKFEELVDRGVNLITELTNYVRLTEPVKTFVAIQEYFEHFFGLARFMIERNIELNTNVSAQGYIKADTHRLDQALFNLLHNAVDAVRDSQEKKIRIMVDISFIEELEREILEDRLTSALRITIDDSGKGIDENIYPRIFDPYFSTKEPKRNTGLGLNVSEQIISEHGGVLLIFPKGELGGAKAVVYLPLSQEP